MRDKIYKSYGGTYVGVDISTETIPNGKIHLQIYRRSCAWTACGLPANFAMVKNLKRIPKTIEVNIGLVTCERCKKTKRWIGRVKEFAVARLTGKKK